MEHIPFLPLPQKAVLSLGGFSCVRPAAWSEYLESTLEERYPIYFREYSLHKDFEKRWMENNCILEALDQYLFDEFGVLIPVDNLFKVYNPSGEGLLPCQILEAISAVVEPLGFEVDKMIVPDDGLRLEMGYPEKVVDLSHAEDFRNKNGIGMINIREGYSHAFYWKGIDPGKFYKEQFRMALMIRPQKANLLFPRSAIASLDSFLCIFQEYLASVKAARLGSLAVSLDALDFELGHLYRLFTRGEISLSSIAEVEDCLGSIIDLVENAPQPARTDLINLDHESILASASMLQRIFNVQAFPEDLLHMHLN